MLCVPALADEASGQFQPRPDSELIQAGVQAGTRDAPTPLGATPQVGEIYVDQVMDSSPETHGDLADEAIDAEDYGVLGPGRTLRGVETGFYYKREGDFDRREQGVTLSTSRETLDYGFLSAEVTGRLQNDNRRFEGDHGSSLIRLRQEGFALGNRWQIDSALGDQVVTADSLVARSFRFSLPSSFLRGAGAALYDDHQEVRVQVGRVGNLDGERILAFDSDGSNVAGIGYRSQFAPRWSGALQVWALRDDARTGDHASAATVLEYSGDGEDRFQLHTLQSSGGNLGAWFDGDQWLGAWRHRYGAFRLDPGLQWLDDPISNDRQGLYWRTDLRATRYTWSLGADLTDTNIDGNPRRAGIDTTSTFVRGTWLARRGTQLGASLDFRTLRDGRGAAVPNEDRTAPSAFISHRWALGTTRLQGDTAFTRGDVVHRNAYELSLDHQWLVTGGADLSTRLRGARERGNNGRRDLLAAGALARFELADNLSLISDSSVSQSDTSLQDTRTFRLNIGLDWQISPQWRFDLTNDLVHARTRGRIASTSRTDLEFFARLRWSETTGSEAAVLGARGDTPGSGRISGVVFFDENRDGTRSPGERPVADALVLLDGRRATARTDSQGRYEFWPVFTGEHQLSLRTEDLPLPWGLEDETPVLVRVAPRGTEIVNFALVRVDE